MGASRYVGRVGGLAVALGVGAAVFTGSGVAWADDESDSQTTSSTGSENNGGSGSDNSPKAISKRIKDNIKSGLNDVSANVGKIGDGEALKTVQKTLAGIVNAGPASSAADQSDPQAGRTVSTSQPKKKRLSSKLTDTTPDLSASVADTGGGSGATDDDVVKLPSIIKSLPTAKDIAPQISSAISSLSTLSIPQRSVITPQAAVKTSTPGHEVSSLITTLASRLLSPFAGNSPSAPPVDSPAALLMLAATRREFSGAVANLAAPTGTTANPALAWGDYTIVSTSPERVISFYGLFNNPPGTPGVLQGTQDFKVVDADGNTVGTFTAMVSNTNDFILGGGTFQEFVVTQSSVVEGADASATPPVGTLISSVSTRRGGSGILYTSTPSGEPGVANVVEMKIRTPLGSFKVPMPYDGAGVLTAVNVPMEVGDGYYIAPAPGQEEGTTEPETITSITGIPPGFTAAQGEQVFAVYKKGENGEPDQVVGTFKGYVTNTSDALGATTQAILVTEVLSGEEGPGNGDVPPVGTVYNVIYRFGIFYRSVPNGDGTSEITCYLQTPIGNIPINTHLDASHEPQFDSFDVPGQYKFVPVDDMTPIGINGLPPREVQIQGYQQFDVYDEDGNYLGRVDADVTNQWGPFGAYTGAILVTNVSDVPEGIVNTPTVGSQYNFAYNEKRRFSAVYAATNTDPVGNDDDISFYITTPFGVVKLPAGYNAIKNLNGDVEYYVPPAPVQV